MKRSDSDTIERRMMADRKDFIGFTEFDIKITDSRFNCHNLLDKIKK